MMDDLSIFHKIARKSLINLSTFSWPNLNSNGSLNVVAVGRSECPHCRIRRGAGRATWVCAAPSRSCACLGRAVLPCTNRCHLAPPPELAASADEEDAHGEGAHVNVQHFGFALSTFSISNYNIYFVPFQCLYLKC